MIDIFGKIVILQERTQKQILTSQEEDGAIIIYLINFKCLDGFSTIQEMQIIESNILEKDFQVRY